jgi:hypothetical protein
MSATNPDSNFAVRHSQLTPFLVATVITAVTAAIALAFTGLPY